MWLVTGAQGQLGRSLTELLSNSSTEYVGTSSRELDITNKDLIHGFISKLKPSVIINTAAWTEVDSAECNVEAAMKVNADGPLHLASSAKKVGALFVHISTDYVFSGETHFPWQEDSLRVPISVYGKSKARGEELVMDEYPEGSYIVRTAWLYSQWGRNFAKTMTKLALFGEGEVRVVADQIGQPTSAADLAAQIVSTVNAQVPTGIYHGTNSGQATWFDFATAIFMACDADRSRLNPTDSTSYVRPAQRPTYSVLGHARWHSNVASKDQVSPMRNWEMALSEIMPEIIARVKVEE
jgi:dTDP-4-dehydrorhamnose reductase